MRLLLTVLGAVAVVVGGFTLGAQAALRMSGPHPPAPPPHRSVSGCTGIPEMLGPVRVLIGPQTTDLQLIGEGPATVQWATAADILADQHGETTLTADDPAVTVGGLGCEGGAVVWREAP